MANNLHNHERRDKSKWFVTLIAFILAFVAIAAAFIGIFSDGFTNWDKFKTDEEQQDEQLPEEEQTDDTADGGAPVTDENGDELASNKPIAMPMSMTFRSAASLDGRNAEYDSVTVRATVTPSDADLESFVYTVEWVNPSSAWATGKTVTDYFTVTQATENSLQATLQCLQPFGEQIKVEGTATSLDGKSASAECTIDFAKRLVDFQFMSFDGGMPIYHTMDTDSIDFLYQSVRDNFQVASLSGTTSTDYDIEYSAYTVDTSITFDFVIGAYASVLSSASSDLGMTLSAVDSSVLLPMASPRSFISCVRVNGSGDLSTSQQNELIGWLYDNQDTPVFFLKFTASSDYQSIEKVIPVTFPASGLVISVTGVSLDQDSVII